MKNNNTLWIIAIVPFFIITIGLLMLGRQTLHYTTSSDPEYFYLINALSIAQLKIISGNYIHPGIPMQYLSGIIVGIDYLISGKSDSIIYDVMLRSEHYINVINGTLLFLTGIVFFVCGYYIYKFTNSLAVAIFLQLVAFTDQTGFFQLTLIVPEKLIFPAFIILITLVIKYIETDLNQKQERNLIISISFIVAFCVMQKFTMLPLLILPIIIFSGKKNILTYLISVMIFILFFFIPIITHLKHMYEYFNGMITHSGLYGSGKKEIIELNSIRPNLEILIRDHGVAFYSFLLLILSLPLLYFQRTEKTERGSKLRRVIIAFVLTEMLMLLMLFKHFKSHYFAPGVALSFFNIYLFISLLREISFLKLKRIAELVLYLTAGVIVVINYPKIDALFRTYDSNKEYESQLIQLNSQYENMPKIILPQYYGTQFEEFAVYQAIYYSDNYKEYGEYAKNLWPVTYFYTSEWGLYDLAYNRFTLSQVLNLHPNFVVGYYNNDQALENFYTELENLGKYNDYSFSKLYFNNKNNFVLESMTSREIWKDSLKIINQYEMCFEKDSTDFNSQFASSLISHSGYYSLILDNKNEYSPAIILDSILPGDLIQASVWRLRNGNKSVIVISNEEGTFYNISKQNINAEDYWDKIEITLSLPDTLKANKIKVYLWQNDKNTPAYFDDFAVSLYRNTEKQAIAFELSANADKEKK